MSDDVARLVAGLDASVDALAGDRGLSADIGSTLRSEISRRVPRRSGALDRSLTVESGAGGGRVTASTPYARVIHDGWPRRGIEPHPFIVEGTDAAMRKIADLAGDHAGEALGKVSQ